MTEPKPITMSKAVRKAHEHDAERLRSGIGRQEGARDAAIEKLTADRNAKLAIDRQQLAAIELALSDDDAKIAGTPV